MRYLVRLAWYFVSAAILCRRRKIYPLKLIVQIPCHNEEATLQQTVADIPYEIAGVDQVEILVVDDGSTDRTAALAREVGVNQYAGRDIPRLIQPILDGRADIVVGDRQTDRIAHFSWAKKRLQRTGSYVVRKVSGVDVPDAVSGFRAFSRDAALQMNIVSSFSYTIETLIQAGRKRIAVASVPVATNPKTRDSRLFTSLPQFLERSLSTLLRMYTMYRPLKVFVLIGLALSLIGAAPIVRFGILTVMGGGGGHIQSLVIGGALLVIGLVTFLIGLVADLISHNRQLIEMTLEKVRRLELAVTADDAHGADTPPARRFAPLEHANHEG